ncbi:hypothetical protein Tco_1506289 [Tanacetum coccineum]
MSQENEVQNKFYKTREDKEIEKVIALENKVKVLDDIVYKTGQSVQTMNILNRNYKMSFVKPEYLKKAQRVNPCLYDIGCYNDNLALMEYYYTDHMNAILGVYTKLDEVTNLQCDYLEALKKCERLKNELSKRNTTSKSFEPLQQHAINLELALQQNSKAQLQDKDISISELKKLIEKMKGKSVETKFEKPSVIRQPNAFKSQRQSVLGVIPTTSVSRPRLKSNQLEDRVMDNNSQGKKQQTSNVNFVYVTCGKYVLNDNHDMCVLHYINGVNSRTKQPIVVPISTREPKRNVNQSVATPLMKTVNLESTNQKPRSTTRKQYKHVTHRDNSIHHRLWVLKAHDEKSQDSKYGENLDKMKEKGDACIFVGYSTQSRAYRMASDHVSSDTVPQSKTVTTSNELDLLFSLMFDELLNGTTPIVAKSSAVTATDVLNQHQQQNTTPSTSTTVASDIPHLNIQTTPETTNQAPTQAPSVTAIENINQAKTDQENAQVKEDEFINIFSTLVQE